MCNVLLLQMMGVVDFIVVCQRGDRRWVSPDSFWGFFLVFLYFVLSPSQSLYVSGQSLGAAISLSSFFLYLLPWVPLTRNY